MKFIAVLLLITLVPMQAFASCGEVPPAPGLLQTYQVNTEQLESLDDQLNGYLLSIQGYQDCIDGQVVGLDPEAEDYDTLFEDLMILMDAAEQQKLLAVQRFNQHVDTVDTESEEENQESAEEPTPENTETDPVATNG